MLVTVVNRGYTNKLPSAGFETLNFTTISASRKPAHNLQGPRMRVLEQPQQNQHVVKPFRFKRVTATCR